MTFNVRCNGCTNAGVRKVKTLAFWTCDVCGNETDKYACPNICGTRRPEPVDRTPFDLAVEDGLI